MPHDFPTTLDNYAIEALIKLAAFHRLPDLANKGKARLIKALTAYLTQPVVIQRNYSQLTPALKAAVDAIHRRDGETSVYNLRIELSALGLIEENSKETSRFYDNRREADPNNPDPHRLEDILARLALVGLVFSAAPEILYGNRTNKVGFRSTLAEVTIPPEVREHLPEPAPLPEIDAGQISIQTVSESSARTFQRELYLYWDYIRVHPPLLTKQGELNKRTLTEINDLMLVKSEIVTGTTENDYPRLRFIRALLTGLKLLVPIRPQHLEVYEKSDFFSLSPEERVRRCFTAWRQGDFFSELVMLPEQVRPRASMKQNLLFAGEQVIKARQYVLDQTAKISPGNWVSFRRLVHRIKLTNYEFLFRRSYTPANF